MEAKCSPGRCGGGGSADPEVQSPVEAPVEELDSWETQFSETLC